jgi:hypothetical protein
MVAKQVKFHMKDVVSLSDDTFYKSLFQLYTAVFLVEHWPHPF